MIRRPTKDLDFINEEGDPLKSEKAPAPKAESYPEMKPEMQKAKKPGILMGLLNQPETVGSKVRSGKMKEAKQIIAHRIGQSWASKKPNLPDIKKMIDMFKDDGFAFSEEGQKVLKEMQKRFDKACKGKMGKAQLNGPQEPELFKNFEHLAASLVNWGPDLKKKDSGWRQAKGSRQPKWQHPEHGSVIERGGEFHAVPHGKEYITSTHASLHEAQQALKKPQK